MAKGKLAPAQQEPRDTYRVRTHHQGDAPVDHNGDGAAGEDALAPLEVEHAGEHVAQQTEQARPILRQGKADGLAAHHNDWGGNQLAEGDSGHSFEHVAQNHHKGEGTAKCAIEVGEPRVAAAVGTHIIVENVLGDDHRSVEAAAEISHYRHKKRPAPQLYLPVVNCSQV